jgi:hypothetical protein
MTTCPRHDAPMQNRHTPADDSWGAGERDARQTRRATWDAREGNRDEEKGSTERCDPVAHLRVAGPAEDANRAPAQNASTAKGTISEDPKTPSIENTHEPTGKGCFRMQDT